MRNKKLPMRIRFANASEYTTLKIAFESFKPDNEFRDEIFGWIDNIYVAIKLDDWKKAIQIREAEEKSSSWDLTIISEKEDGYIVSTPIGDTQYMSKNDYEAFIKKQNKK